MTNSLGLIGVIALIAFGACKTPNAPAASVDAGGERDARVEDSAQEAEAAVEASTTCGPARVIRIGEHAMGYPFWSDDDTLMDRSSGFDPETFSPRKRAATPPKPAERWTIVSGGDNTIDSIIDARTGKKVPIDASDVRPELGLAVDKSGRLYDLDKRTYLTAAFACGGSQGATYSLSHHRRFIICDAHGEGVAIMDIAAKWTAELGDGDLTLSPNEVYGVMTPGPFDGYWGHVDTKRKSVDTVVWDDSGRVTTKTIGTHEQPDPSVQVGDDVVVVSTKRRVVVRRRCDAAVIHDDPAALPAGSPKSSPVMLSPSGKYLLVEGATRTAIFRIE